MLLLWTFNSIYAAKIKALRSEQWVKQGMFLSLQGCRLHPGWAAGPQASASRNLWDPAGGPDRAAAGNSQREHLAGETPAVGV